MHPKSEVSSSSSNSDWLEVIKEDTKILIKIQTWRDPNDPNAPNIQKNLEQIRQFFLGKAQKFNQAYPKTKIEDFSWTSAKNPDYRVFGFRAGTCKRKMSLICHLDTVPPGSDDWRPFEPREEMRQYKGVPTPFLIGRGAIDDKGPAVVAFEAFTRALKAVNEESASLNDVTLEVLFDTSEETDMSTPHYFEENPDAKPALGIVFDAIWSVRAEKGIERPIFTVTAPANAEQASHADSPLIIQLSTSAGPTNMIAATAKATISSPCETPAAFAKKIEAWYRNCPFDDSNYHPAEMVVTSNSDSVQITTKVAGAQHGSAPHQNRATGANPLVSLTNFLAILIERGMLANNYNGEMCRFIRWAFGTRVFGENHPDLLYRFDTVFAEGNGTTYGLTQLIPTTNGLELGIDIRYTIGHHATGWNGSEGKIDGGSLFDSVFKQLLTRYRSEVGEERPPITYQTTNIFGPDIRSPRNANLSRINMAYRSVVGDNCPMQAVGGATDAHGYLDLVTAGALFTDSFGPPINYHGLDEGAPLSDLENSGKILLQLLLQELKSPQTQEAPLARTHQCPGCGI
jgi:succinyl-diaminopimelate desuccinylase